jgi:hypothetical protein
MDHPQHFSLATPLAHPDYPHSAEPGKFAAKMVPPSRIGRSSAAIVVRR